MIVTIHRWASNQNRYLKQSFELESEGIGNNFLGLDFDGRSKATPGFKNFRTQRVDRIEFDTMQGTLNVYCSPVVDRVYKPRERKMGNCKLEGCTNKAVKSTPFCSAHIQEKVYAPLPSSPSPDNSAVIEDSSPCNCLCHDLLLDTCMDCQCVRAPR